MTRTVMARVVVACMAAAGVAAAGMTTAQATPQLAPLERAEGKTLAGKYIVVLKDASTSSGASVAQRHDIKTTQVYSHAVRGFAAALNKAELDAIREDSNVSYVVSDGVAKAVQDKPTPRNPLNLKAPADQKAQAGKKVIGPHGAKDASINVVQPNATWGLDRVDQRTRTLNNTYRYTTTGSGVTAYVIDTGIRASHTDFGARASYGFTAISDGNGAQDCNGHGTHVAGTIGGSTYGVAKAVRLVAVRVLDCSGSGTWAQVIAGIDYVTNTHDGPSVANMSLGGGYNQAVNDAVTNSISSGVTYAVAAGNYDDNACSYSPSSTPGAITVGATDRTDTRAYYSNKGSCVDVFAPGSDITSDWIGSNTATNTISGTSMASPHVAGLAALFLQSTPTASTATVTKTIRTTAVSGLVTDPAGSPNLLARKWNAVLAGTGSSSYEPDGSYWYQAGTGYINATLVGTPGTDTDLYLQKWNGSAWVNVAISASLSARERISYNGGAGYYTMRAYAYSGGGTYDAWATHP